MTSSKTYYPNMDWIRLLLAIQVVYIHSGISTSVLISPVPTFLAVSGFVVFGSVERWPPRQFVVNRALRVLPLLFVSFAAIGLLFGVAPMLHNIVFWLWPFGDNFPVNPVVWSLIYEEFFYGALLVAYSFGAYRNRLVAPCVAAISFIIVASGTSLGLPGPFWLLAGAFSTGNTAYIFRDTVRRYVSPWFATILLVASFYATSSGVYDAIVRPTYIWSDVLSFAAVLIFCISGPRLPRLTLDLSYSMYLLHCLPREYLLQYMPLGWTLFWFTFLATLPLCVASWYVVEKPSLRLRRRFGAVRRVETVPAE